MPRPSFHQSKQLVTELPQAAARVNAVMRNGASHNVHKVYGAVHKNFLTQGEG
jgi:hypothetical protein